MEKPHERNSQCAASQIYHCIINILDLDISFHTVMLNPLAALSVASNLLQLIEVLEDATKFVYDHDAAAAAESRIGAINYYPNMARHMTQRPEHAIVRRFGDLNNASLLYMQAELLSLEHELQQQQEEDLKSNCPMTRSYSTSMEMLKLSQGAGGSKQRDLLLIIQDKLKVYSKG